ncbi:MAG: acyltransferase [Brevundimonas sp.]|nr:MAG: acyltransferase [Brevundimonas sp.]
MEFPPVSSLSVAPSPDRRYDLDWIRVGAFLLLILYHVGMFYVPWDWHVKSGHEVEALEPIMQLTNPWRLTLLFLVSGAATRFLADSLARDGRVGAGRLAGSRTLRLLPPLLFAMFVIVPPQSYYEIVEAIGHLAPQADAYHNAFTADFWVRYATASGAWCDADGCLITPTWNHMWFVAYLLVYSLILAALLAISAGRLRALGGPLERSLKGWGLLIWPIVFLAAIRWGLAYRFEITHDLVNDWYNHSLSFSAFLFGFLTARSEALRQGFIRLRWPALILALAAWAAWAGYAWEYRADDAMPADALRRAMRVVYAADQWAFIAAVLGFGAKHLNHGGPVLRYLTVGVFPFYIVHQTVIVVVGHHLAPLGLPLAAEAGLLIAATLAACFLTYEVARRLGWAGLLLGVRPQAANRPPRAA